MTKVTMLSSPFEARARRATIELDATMELMSSITDSTILSSCTSLGIVLRVSEISSDGDGAHDNKKDGKRLNDAEDGKELNEAD